MMLRSLVVATVVAVVGAALPAASAHADPEPPPNPPPLYRIRNAGSGQCLVTLWRSHDNGDPAVQTPCGFTRYDPDTNIWDDEETDLDPTGVNLFLHTLRWAPDERLCLEVENFSTEEDAGVSLHDCNGGPHQQWRFVPYGRAGTSHLSQWLAGSVLIQNAWSGKCLQLYGPSLTTVGYVVQHTCDRTLNQLWFLEPGSDN
jgi:hypothetical protein